MTLHAIRRQDYKGKKLDNVTRDIKLPFDALTSLAAFFAVPCSTKSSVASASDWLSDGLSLL